MTRFPVLATLALGLLLACGGDAPPKEHRPPREEAIAAMNRGLAALERFEYLPAAREFEAALALSPDWIPAKVNLAIAQLNARGKAAGQDAAQGEYGETRAVLAEILAVEPGNPHANFISGVIEKIQGNTEQAVPYFDRVIAADPRDAATRYWKGSAMMDLGRYAEAEAEMKLAVELDPYLAAAWYARRPPLMHLRRQEEAMAVLKTFNLLQPPPGEQWPIPANLITLKAYTEIGRYAMAIRDYEEPSRLAFTAASPFAGYAYGGEAGPELVPVAPREGDSGADLVLRAASRIGPGVALGDVDGDGDADVFLPVWNGAGRLYRNDGGLRFTDVTAASGIATAARGISAVFFDGDGDGDLDLYLCAAGPNVYYVNGGDGTFTDGTAAAGLAGDPGVVSVSAAAGDFDHEGDVDLFVANYARIADGGLAGAPDALFQNDRNGRFTDVAPAQGIDGGDLRSIGVLPIDVERDLDTDLLVVRDRHPFSLWLNERVWNFRKGELPPELTSDLPAWGAAAGDIDRDGTEEVLVLRGPSRDAEFFREDGQGGLVVDAKPPIGRIRGRTGVFLDADLDGFIDLVGDRILLLGETGRALPAGSPGSGPLPAHARGAGFADLDGDGDLDRVWAAGDGAGIVATEAPAGNHWAAFSLIGRMALQPAAWAAKIGPDQELELRAGRLWQPLRVRTVSGFLSSVEAVARFGLGDRTKVDLLRIMWPDRVLQVEAELPADQVRVIEEVNRKPDSCPMLFCFDGTEYRFVSDFLGVGGLGFFVAPGVTGNPDGSEYVRIGKWAKPKDGSYVLQVMEPLEEICYIDETTLVAVDHPAGWDAWPNERYVGDPALFPEDRIYAVAEKVFPRAATDIAGSDVLGTILTEDRDYAPIRPDRRFPGIAAEHALTLDFTGRVPEAPEGGRLVLFIDGNVEYGYSHTVFAVQQSGVEYQSPRLEVPDGAGGWRTVLANIGFPAGLPKGMTVDVTGIVTPKQPVFRIRSNLEVFWDRIFLGLDRGGEVRVTRVKPATADLHHRGYPREYSPDGRMPIVYDYGLMDPGYPMKNMAGDYTRFGDVTPLVTEADDRYVIMARGEEMTLSYPVSAFPPLAEGYERTLVLYAFGWCKDMDPYTSFPDTVEPLPFRAMSGYPYRADERYPDDAEHENYRREWNQRRIWR